MRFYLDQLMRFYSGSAGSADAIRMILDQLMRFYSGSADAIYLLEIGINERYNFVPGRPYVASRAVYQNVTRVRVTCIYCTCDLLTYDILQAHNAGRKHKKHFEGVEINGLGQSGSHRTNELQQMANASGAINRDLSDSGHKPPVNGLKPLVAFQPSAVNHRQTAGQHNHSDASLPQTPAVANRKTPAPTTVRRAAQKRKSSRMEK
ncbi:hypothetical protein C7M84_011674 [Penaeus vannamei]|uniref:U1-type domain-containing protein n=1 Tax=Penaeus vannamei TaxID=6689 RepID=A0A423T0U0_PENVA|nr:hypothetical protein C7M84_011674 [Penaeus vannamei]